MASRLGRYHRLFGAYAKKYLTRLLPVEMRSMAALKTGHTQRVRAGMKQIGTEIGLDEHGLFLGELAGLFHDIGRFEQLRRFRTFVDRESVNHAELSAEIVLQEGFLKDLEPADCNMVVTAILLHNRKTVPPAGTWLQAVLTLLLRDADKLDIWKVFHDYYSRAQVRGGDDSTLEFNLPDTPGISPEVARDISEDRIVNLAHVRNRNDFAMARLAWVFDINFVPSLKMIKKHGYVTAMERYLPDFPRKAELFRHVSGHLDDMIARSGPAC